MPFQVRKYAVVLFPHKAAFTFILAIHYLIYVEAHYIPIDTLTDGTMYLVLHVREGWSVFGIKDPIKSAVVKSWDYVEVKVPEP